MVRPSAFANVTVTLGKQVRVQLPILRTGGAMVDMLIMWFWAYVIGVGLSALIVFWAFYFVLIKPHLDKRRADESPLDRWKNRR